jgi:hypothetical protein
LRGRSDEFGDDLAVECGASGGDARDGLEEFAYLADAFFEQVADAGLAACEEFGCVCGLDVLGEDEDG